MPKNEIANTAGEELVSVITPAFNESSNLRDLYERLEAALSALEAPWEWIAIDDHSDDDTFRVLRGLCASDHRIRAFRLSRNSGSHRAIICGLEKARGACAVVMAADLQDPPEAVGDLLERWNEGAQVVWGVRSSRREERLVNLIASRVYYWIMRYLVGLSKLPATGADFVLLDRRVIDAVGSFPEDNTSILALLSWIGFRQEWIRYSKSPRQHGDSGWTLRRKIKLVLDSVTSFSYFPLRLMSYFGFAVASAGFFYALLILSRAFGGSPVQGWASLMVVTLVLGGAQMLMMGVLGEYLWRALHEARGRPRFLIEDEIDDGGAR